MLAALLLLVVLFNRSLPVNASPAEMSQDRRFSTTDTEQQFSTPSGLTGLLGMHSSLRFGEDDSVLQFDHGSLLVKTFGELSIDAGFETQVSMFAGSMLMLRDDTSVTVVALLAPVVLLQKGTLWTLPQGSQIRITLDRIQRSSVPPDWLLEQTARSRALPIAQIADLQSLSAMLQDSTMTIAGEQIRSTLPEDSSDLESFVLALRLSLEADRLESAASDIITKRILSQPDCTDACVFGIPAIAASSLQPLPPELLKGWVELTINHALSDPVRTVSLLHAAIPGLPARFEAAGYPKQALLWRSAIAELESALSAQFTGSEKDQFASDIALSLAHDVPTHDPVSASSDTAPAPAAVARYTEQELKIFGRELLDHYGVLFTRATRIEVDISDQDCARITNVFIAEGTRDVPYEFSYCPADTTLRRIIRDSKRLPNSVPVERFFH